MKKLKPKVKIIIAAVVVVAVVLLIIFLLSINKKVYSPTQITKVFESNNLITTDLEALGESEFNSHLEARNKESSFKIEYFQFSNEKQAEKYYEKIIASLEAETGGLKGKVETNKIGFYKYTLEASGNYLVIVRSKNTIIYENTNEKNKELVDKIIKSLKY